MIGNTLRHLAGSAVTRIALAAFVLMLALSGVAARPQAAEASTTYATLCTDIKYQGTCKTYYNSIPSLGSTEIGNDTLSSLKVPAGTRVVLFEHDNYTGRCQSFSADTWTLVGSYIANDQASSVGFGSYACLAPKHTVQTDGNYGWNHLYSSVDRLDATNVGNDSMSSIWVASGVTVALYSDINFEGTCQTFVGDGTWKWLGSYRIGTNKASSLWLHHQCDQDVQLCEHEHAGGRCVSFRSDKPNLTYTDIGNDTASSIRIPDGWQAFIWTDSNYGGTSEGWIKPGWYNIGSNWNSSVPNDSASSIKVSTR
jgi:hypothetical protein